MANWFKLENYELISVSKGYEAKSVLILTALFDEAVRFTNTLELKAYLTTESITDTVGLTSACRGALDNGCEYVYVAPTLASVALVGNAIRPIINLTPATGEGSITNASLLASMVTDEADGILRILVADATVSDTIGRCVWVDVGMVQTAPQTGVAETQKYALGAIAGLICSEAKDPSLPISNVPVKGISELVSYQTQASCKTKYQAGETTFHIIDGEVCVFAIPTTVTATGSVWKDLTTRLIADDIAESVFTMLRRTYRRTKNSSTVLASIRGDIDTILNSYSSREIIENYDKSLISVIKDPADEYGCIISYVIDVVTPLYNVTVKQSVTLSL